MAGELKVSWRELYEFSREVFVRAGLPPRDADAETSALLWANLRGVDSHGVLRIPWYVENIDTGVMNPRPNIQIIKETPATLFLEADRAMGPVATIFAVNLAVRKAKESGICWALIRNLTHQGALGYYSQMIAERDMAGIVFVCDYPNMAPYGAKAAGVSNNPIAIAVPTKRHSPLNLDMATSVVAGGKIWLAIDKDVPIPKGWALDEAGNPTTNPRSLGILLPFSGPKGSGLAIMFECLASVMAGNPLLALGGLNRQTEAPKAEKKGKTIGERASWLYHHIQNSVVAVIDIGAFTDVDSYKEHVDRLIDGIKALPRAEGFTEIFVPGELEEKTCQDRSRNGIPLPEGTVHNLQSIAKRFDVKLPAGL